jgi:hypothetical protein
MAIALFNDTDMFFSNAVEDMHDENVCSFRETPNYFSLKKTDKSFLAPFRSVEEQETLTWNANL